MIGRDEIRAILGKVARDAGCVFDPAPAIDAAERALIALIGESLAEVANAHRAASARCWREVFRLAEQAGWSAFGSHIDQPDIELEFDGRADDGLPLWEREKRG